jgi:hypothetical protein
VSPNDHRAATAHAYALNYRVRVSHWKKVQTTYKRDEATVQPQNSKKEAPRK